MLPFIKKKISRQNHCRPDLLQFADEQRKQGWFNDVTIEVENHFIPANRMVLSCCSNYFKNMFKTSMKERYEHSIKLEFDERSMKLLIDFIYTGNIDIDDENVINLLSAADYLQLDQVKQFCFEFLESILTTESCFEILTAADLYRDDSLKNKVYQFISLKLDQIIKTESFKNLSKSALVSCISNLDRDLSKETSIYHAIIVWVNEDKNVRENEFSELFQKIKLKRLSIGFLASVITNEYLVEKNLVCSNLALKAIAKKTRGSFFDKLLTILGLVRVSDKKYKIYEFGQNFENLGTNFPDLPEKDSCGPVFKLNDYVFCRTNSTIWKLNLTDRNKAWQRVSVNTSLCNLSFYDTALVNFGENGNATYLDLTSVHSPKWENLASFNRQRSLPATACCGGSLYALGGSDSSVSCTQKSSSLKNVERLSGLAMKWQDDISMQTERAYFTAVSYKHYIFALGGYDSNKIDWLKSVEVFDTSKQTWTFVKPMINERRSHTACVVEDKIFVAGGYNQKGYVMDVECYDILYDEWSVVQRLDPVSYRILSICS